MKKEMKKLIKKFLPPWAITVLYRIRRLFVYDQHDSSEYWRSRASCSGQSAVLWQNQEYNNLYRKIQYDFLRSYVVSLKPGSRVLDIGCGIGLVSEMLLSMNPQITVDAVDFQEMIDVARSRVRHKKVRFLANSADSYYLEDNIYDMVLSSGCYSAISNIQKLEKAMANGAKMLKPNGIMVMMDPFHRWNYLARAKYGTEDVIRFLRQYNLIVETKSGVLFWPFREWLANSRYTGKALENRFYAGERILSMLGRHFWADYKVLVFRKTR